MRRCAEWFCLASSPCQPLFRTKVAKLFFWLASVNWCQVPDQEACLSRRNLKGNFKQLSPKTLPSGILKLHSKAEAKQTDKIPSNLNQNVCSPSQFLLHSCYATESRGVKQPTGEEKFPSLAIHLWTAHGKRDSTRPATSRLQKGTDLLLFDYASTSESAELWSSLLRLGFPRTGSIIRATKPYSLRYSCSLSQPTLF